MAEKTAEEIAAEKAAKWIELFADEDPTKVKEALDHARLWEKRAKENVEKAAQLDAVAEKAKKYDELQESSKSELEKERDRAERAEKALKDKEAAEQTAKEESEAAEAAKKLRDEVAEAKKVDASVLRGSTKEELESHADELLKFKGETPGAPGAEGQGKQGEPISHDGEKSAEEIAASALGR